MMIHELKYSNTNTYLIEGEKGYILFDTGWAGTFPAFCRCMGDLKIPVQKIRYILISHFHPDHCGTAQEIASYGPVIAVMDVQQEYIHAADPVFAKEQNRHFRRINDEEIRIIPLAESRSFLLETGLDGEIIHTPGHSDDSISLFLDDGSLFVGDLNPLYELSMHKGTLIEDSWNRLLDLHPKRIYYGHARSAVPDEKIPVREKDEDLYSLTKRIIKYIDKGVPLDMIRKKTATDPAFIEDVARMYLTHQNVGVQGILDRIEIRSRSTRIMGEGNDCLSEIR